MSERYAGTLRFVYSHWPSYVWRYGGGALAALVLVLLSAAQGWLWLIPIIFAFLLFLLYFLFVSLWAAYRRYDDPRAQVADMLFGLGKLDAADHVIHIGLGERALPLQFVRHLTTGHLTIIDIYSPQVTPSASLRRLRELAPAPMRDPRLTWLQGSIDMLPMGDESVQAVTMCEAAAEIWQQGDRERLFYEIYRVLKPGGRFLMAERVRSQTNWLVLGVRAAQLYPTSYWDDLMRKVGLTPEREYDVQGLMHYFRADKITQAIGRQLRLWPEE